MSFYGATKSDCLKQARAAEEAAGRTIDAASLTVAVWLTDWLETSRRQGRIRPRTADYYDEHVRRMIPGLGKILLTEITSWDIQRWLNGELAGGLGLKTVRDRWAVLRTALADAKRLRLVAENQASGDFIRLPLHHAKPAKHLEPTEVARCADILLRQASEAGSHHERAEATLLLVGLTTGVRNSEILGLAWPQVVIDPGAKAGRIHICRVLQRVRDHDSSPRVHTNGRTIRPKKSSIGPPKSHAGNRRIELYPEVAFALQAEHDRQRLARWEALPEGDLVFRTRFGKPLSDTYLNQRMRRLCLNAGIAYRSFYALRHTVASAAYQAGETDVSLAELLGHADASMTRRTYAHMSEEHKRPRMEKMRSVMFGLSSAEDTNSV